MSSFGGSVKLTGESEYKKALADISNNLKVLNSEMKVVTSEYDKNDKSVENLSAQNEVLTKKMDEQQKKVNILADALAKSKEETGENSDTTKKWQLELNNAQAELNKLNRNVESNKSAMQEATNVTKAEADAVEDFGEEAKKSGDKALSLGDIIKANLISDAIKSGLSALANGIKSVGSAMSESLSAGAEYADNILTLSAQTGLSTDTLEKYNAVAELADVSIETFTGSLAKTTKAMGEAQNGSAKYVEAYDKLGVKVTDANGNLRDSEDVYWETVDALKGIQNETERDALAMELFGKKAQDLNTIIEMGSEGFKELEQSAIDMGAVLGGQGLEALGKLDDQMQIFKSTTSSTKNILASAFAPAMSGAMGEVNQFAGSINGLIASILGGDGEAVDEAMVRVSEELGDMVSTIAEVVPQMVEVAGQLITALVETIVADLPWVVEEIGALIPMVLEVITNALPGLLNTIANIIPKIITVLANALPKLLSSLVGVVAEVVKTLASNIPQILDTVSALIPQLVITIVDSIPLLLDAVLTLVMAIVDSLPTIILNIVNALPDVIQAVVDALLKAIPLILNTAVQLLMSIVNAIPQIISALVKALPQIIETIITALTTAIPLIIDGALNLLMSILEAIPVVISALVEAIPTIINTIIDQLLNALPAVLDGAVQLLMGIVMALPEIIQALIVEIPKVQMTISKTLLSRLPDLIKSAVELLMGIVKAIPQIIVQLGKEVPKIVVQIATSLKNGISNIASVGKNLVQGLWQGIKDAGAWILDKIKGFGKSILDGIKGFFGIKSPSRLFKDEVGKNLALGVGEGFADTMAEVSADMQNSIPTEFDTDISANINASSVQSQMSTYDMMVSAFKVALTEVKVVMDDREMGGFVTNTVERVVFA